MGWGAASAVREVRKNEERTADSLVVVMLLC
jgi:hypothetical protein